MKTRVPIKTLWRSLASFFVLGLFIWLAVGSVSENTNYVGDGVYRTTIFSPLTDSKCVFTGKRDAMREFHGPVKIEHFDRNGQLSVEEANLRHGYRHGKSQHTYVDGRVENICYNMGIVIDCEKSSTSLMEDLTTLGVLADKYPWFLFAMIGINGNEALVIEYINALDAALAAGEFSPDDFDSYYEDALSTLEEVEGISEVAGDHDFLVNVNGVEVMKKNELRCAVLVKNKMGTGSIYNVVEESYPGYLNLMLSSFTAQDFEGFCNELDVRMNAYGPLDQEDVLFLDSVDVRFNRALSEILSDDTEKSDLVARAEEAIRSNDIKTLRHLKNQARQLVLYKQDASDPSDVALIVAFVMQFEISQADPLRKASREVWLPDEIKLPVVSTAFVDAVSSGSATISGYVAESGGAEVIERGVAYTTTYNPTVENNKILSGTGTGEFTVVISDLTPGVTYHARAFATNSEGTAYGNNVEFTTDSGTGIVPVTNDPVEFSVYPVPAFKLLWVEFYNPGAAETTVSLLNVAGRVLRNQVVDSIGNQKISLNMDGLRPGVYFVRLRQGDKVETRKVVLQ